MPPRAKPRAPRADRLVAAANKVRANAYAPYSKFKVGAAVLTESGKIYSGCNVENASYGLTLCAERSAVAAAVAAGARSVVAVAVASGSEQPAPPCGMCLQTLMEFGDAEVAVILVSGARKRQLKLGELMPQGFGKAFL